MKLSRNSFRVPFFLFAFFFLASTAVFASDEGRPIAWRPWSDKVFDEAAAQNKLVILDLEAVWCHWCHVMADTTYRDPKVVELINAKFIPVRVDQDANPDISVRYEQWGWPATIIFSPKGEELVKRRGYIEPGMMAGLLDAVVKDPTPGPSVTADAETPVSGSSALSPEQKKNLEEDQLSFYDEEQGSWGQRLKLIDPNYLEWAMTLAAAGDAVQAARVKQTLDHALLLEDGAWGGFFQYSETRDWKGPHYEKIMTIQTQYMRLYAAGYLLTGDVRYKEAAERTARFVRDFWTSPDGAFYTSQDADVDASMKGREFYGLDDAARRRLGKEPRIDRHVYARENGWMISSLLWLYDAGGDPAHLEAAKRSAEWVRKNRAIGGGGFRHDDVDRAGPYLGDTLAMAQAFLDLYRSAADRAWLAAAEESAGYIEANFFDADGSAITAKIPEGASGVFTRPVKQIDENVSTARFFNLLYHYTGKKSYKDRAESVMKYLASPRFTGKEHFLCGLLIADRELASDPSHATVIGPKKDPGAASLYAEALKYPSFYRRIEWWDRAEGPLANPDVEYPEFDRASAFLCANKACSTPMFKPEKLKDNIASKNKSPR